MLRMKSFGILIALLVVVEETRGGVPHGSHGLNRYGRPVIPCSSSSECPDNSCCRNADGHLVNGEGQELWGGLELGLENGTCSRAVSGPGAVCTERCGCQKGYTCYRTVTGFCCPPTTCWEAEKARIDREYWQNCSKDPDCHFPPSVNPGGQGIGGLK
ncbi:uncharacterized protein LOC128211931 [Mya arenaria]|uniref:uncharacterized protein LOC128211931 n=1 Tax=Mya arenaria TaxID=6604 RepID=UPI0022DECBFE|nr:uncharacterized protein LOC128211931 [Mya arenaria]